MSGGLLSEAVAKTDFLHRFTTLVARIAGSQESGDVAQLLGEVAALCRADRAAFASVIDDDERYESYRFILAGDPTWCLGYEEGARHLDDPWLEHARRHADPVVAHRVRGTSPDFAGADDIDSAFVVPALAPRGLTRFGCLVIGARDALHFDDPAAPTLGLVARGLAQELLAWQITRLRLHLLSQVRLSSEDLQLLAMEQKARSSKQAAKLTACTPISVDSRWQRLKAKLRVSSRRSAARLAAEYELIQL